jgi:S1-C subfamily serine protease
MTDASTEEDFVPLPLNDSEQLIADRMIATLTIYPQLSYSMLQVGIGTALPPKMWHPVLERLKKEGKIVEVHKPSRSPLMRDLVHRILMLRETYEAQPK